jgi:oligo-1,6-glucosidase
MRNWWKEEIIYQIYPRSFKDTSGDGIGDIQGIISKLDNLKDLGIGVIWLSPVYKSPNKDNGYDVADYLSINPEYGTMEDMDLLLAEAEKRDIRIVMDLIINHTSDQHEWFQKSIDGIQPYKDYYIWRDPKKGKEPSNWTSFFTGKAWEYNEKRKQYYLHLFAKGQPDLNYHNPKVIEEIKNIIRFWLDKGVKGFRCDVINILYKSTLEDGKKQLALRGLEHYLSQEGNHEILQELRRDVFDKYDCFTVGETVLVDIDTARRLTNIKNNELDMLFSFEHMEADQYLIKWFKRKFNSKKFFLTLSKWQKELDWNANYFENHDQLRSVSRFGNDKEYWLESAKMLGLLLLTLKGTPFIYQGQEIGMTNFDFTSIKEVRDIDSLNADKLLKRLFVPKIFRWNIIKKSSRDNVRTPYQWNDTYQGGFTSGNPWLNVNKNYKSINYSSQMNDTNSILSFYKEIIRVRKENKVLVYGDFKDLLVTKRVFIYERYDEKSKLIIAINISNKPQNINFTGKIVLSNYKRELFDGTLNPFESVIIIEATKSIE